jgi:hypothetical protein
VILTAMPIPEIREVLLEEITDLATLGALASILGAGYTYTVTVERWPWGREAYTVEAFRGGVKFRGGRSAALLDAAALCAQNLPKC